MRGLWLSLGIGFGILLSTLTVSLLVGLKDNRNLRAENRKLAADVQQVTAQMQLSSAEKTAAVEKLSAKESEVDALQGKLDKVEAGKATNAETAAPLAYQVRAYLGREYLGMAWVVPTKISKDPETGAITSEPVVVMNEALRKTFTELQTKVVEREVPVSTTVNYNYDPYPYYPYYWYYPSLFSTNGTITKFPPKPNPTLPSTARAQVGGSAWSPVTLISAPPARTTGQRSGGVNVMGIRQPVMNIPVTKAQVISPPRRPNF